MSEFEKTIEAIRDPEAAQLALVEVQEMLTRQKLESEIWSALSAMVKFWWRSPMRFARR